MMFEVISLVMSYTNNKLIINQSIMIMIFMNIFTDNDWRNQSDIVYLLKMIWCFESYYSYIYFKLQLYYKNYIIKFSKKLSKK